MDAARPTLLLTRPAAQAQEFLQTVHLRFDDDWPAIVSPMMEIMHLPPELRDLDGTGPQEDLIFTSVHAVCAVKGLEGMAGRRAFCVGERTAAAAAAAGFVPVTGPGDANALIPMIVAQAQGHPLLYPHGRHRAADLSTRLAPYGIVARSMVVYDQVARPLNAAARTALQGNEPILVPLFSARAAALFAAEAKARRAPLHLLAISDAVADTCGNLRARTLVVPRRPNAAGMIETMAELDAAGLWLER